MNMKITTLMSLALLLAFAAGSTADAQTMQFADYIIINEVDTNPPGDDSKTISEWIELHNPTSDTVDLGGWQIISTTVNKTMVIPSGTVIKPGQFLTYSYQPVWFTDVSESIELRNTVGVVVDRTPRLTDLAGGLESWQRIYDALDSDSADDWTFGTPSIGSTNGRPDLKQESEPKAVSVTVDSDRSSYLFGQTAVIRGTVSERVFMEKPTFLPEQIKITISGPEYHSAVTMYPNLLLEYSTKINLRQILGVNEGIYNVTVTYGDAIDTTQFSVGNKIIEIEQSRGGILSIETDSESYLPGQTVVILASTTREIPLEGLRFSVYDPNSNVVTSGNLFPSSDVNTLGIFTDSDSAQFVTNMLISPISQVYGQYRIAGQYGDQTAEHFFTVNADIKEDVPISLNTDKDVYEPGDAVMISGRSNQHWVASLDLEIIKSTNLALGTGSHAGGGTGLKILDVVRLAGDGSFSYVFQIPSSFTSFDEYRIKISGDIGTVTKTFVIAENAKSHSVPDDPFFIFPDKGRYDVGSSAKITGMITEQIQKSGLQTEPVHLKIIAVDGADVSTVGLPTDAQTHTPGGLLADLSMTAIPDLAGRFETSFEIPHTLFNDGIYVITARYGNMTTHASFVVVDPMKIGKNEIIAFLDKQVYGLGETLQLTGTFGAQSRDNQGVTITVHKPDGDTDKFGTTIDAGKFSWSWDTPRFEVTTGLGNERVVPKSNLGVYKINLETEGNDADIFFKVSLDPERDSLNLEPLTVSTEQSTYKPGTKLVVSGHVITRIAGDEGLVIPPLVNIKVLSNKIPFAPIHESNVYPKQGGFYSSTFELPATIFLEGTYKVKATYLTKVAYTEFDVVSKFVFGGDQPVELILNLDGDTYHPGDSVILTGQPNKIVHIEKFDVSVIQSSESSITCGSFYCGTHVGPVTSIRPDPSAGFVYNYTIPLKDSLGSYEITVDAGFDTRSVTFDVVERTTWIVDKASRIADSEITITPERKVFKGIDLAPVEIFGSLLTSRGNEQGVNLHVATTNGTCIIGQDDGCIISNSTGPEDSATMVHLYGIQHLIRYTGPDAVFERFSILPAQEGSGLTLEPFHVSVIKEDQVSRFYYQVVYEPVDD